MPLKCCLSLGSECCLPTDIGSLQSRFSGEDSYGNIPPKAAVIALADCERWSDKAFDSWNIRRENTLSGSLMLPDQRNLNQFRVINKNNTRTVMIKPASITYSSTPWRALRQRRASKVSFPLRDNLFLLTERLKSNGLDHLLSPAWSQVPWVPQPPASAPSSAPWSSLSWDTGWCWEPREGCGPGGLTESSLRLGVMLTLKAGISCWGCCLPSLPGA